MHGDACAFYPTAPLPEIAWRTVPEQNTLRTPLGFLVNGTTTSPPVYTDSANPIYVLCIHSIIRKTEARVQPYLSGSFPATHVLLVISSQYRQRWSDFDPQLEAKLNRHSRFSVRSGELDHLEDFFSFVCPRIFWPLRLLHGRYRG